MNKSRLRRRHLQWARYMKRHPQSVIARAYVDLIWQHGGWVWDPFYPLRRRLGGSQ